MAISGLIAGDALDVIDAHQRQLFHPLQHLGHKPRPFIQRHVAYRIPAGKAPRRRRVTGGYDLPLHVTRYKCTRCVPAQYVLEGGK